MATSPIYNWPEPDNTDLVKNGALAIRTLGDAIDTTMATMTPKSLVDAKGDLIAASAADTPARLAVGSDGETLVADSSTATGLRWQGSYPAGKNVLINGLLDIWQRSTSVTFSGEALNAQDRWYNFATNSSTFARESSIVPVGCTYSSKVTIGATASAAQSSQVIETLNAAPYAGQTMTFSGYFQSSATPTITFVVYWSSSVDVANGGAWTTLSATSGGSGTAGSSSFTRISGVYAIPSTAKSLKVLWYSSSIASAGVLYWGGMQFEAGSVPTTLVRNGATIQGELAACQRYYFRLGNDNTAVNRSICSGAAYASNDASGVVQFPTTMRTTPTLNATSGTNYYGFLANSATDGLDSFTLGYADRTSAIIYNNSQISQTAGHGGVFITQSASASVAFSAEL